MDTDDLINQLAAEETPGPARYPLVRFGLPLLGAGVLAIVLLTLVLGPPLAEVEQTGMLPFAIKTLFSASVALFGAIALFTSGRPGTLLQTRLLVVALPFAAIAGLALSEFSGAAPQWPGASWRQCIASIALLTPLAFVGTMLALKRLAPVRLALSGALAGLAASGTAATAYALWCPETNALFLVSWYAGTMLVSAVIGTLLGPKLLRW